MSDATSTTAAPDKYSEAMRRFSGDLRMVRQVWQSMADRGVTQEAHHWSLYLDAHLANNDLDGAAAVVATMREQGLEVAADMPWRIALAAARSGRTATATELLDDLRSNGVHPPDHLLTSVFSTEIALGRLPAARGLVRRMGHAGVAGSAEEYGVLAKDVLARRAIKDAEALVPAMIAAGRPPSPELCASLVAMIARTHVERAEALLGVLDEAGVEVGTEARSAIVSAHASGTDVKATRRALEAVDAKGDGVTSHHRNLLLAGIIQQGSADASWREALKLVDAGAIPSGANLDGLVKLDLAVGKWWRALGGLDWMVMLGVPPPANRVADLVGQLLEEDVDKALAVYREFAGHGVPPDRRRGGQLVDALVRAGRLDEARTLLRQLATGKVLTKGQHWSSLLSALARKRRNDDVRAVVDEMVAVGVRPTSADAARILTSILRPKDPQPAWELLLRLTDGGLQLDEPTWREFLWAFARLGRGEATREVYVRMHAAGIPMKDRHQKALDWATGETARRLEDVQQEDGDDDLLPEGASLEPEDVAAEAEAAEAAEREAAEREAAATAEAASTAATTAPDEPATADEPAASPTEPVAPEATDG